MYVCIYVYMHLPLNVCKEKGLLYSVFRCFYCGFVKRAMVCKAVSWDWGCCLTCCWAACCIHSFPTACSLFQFLNTLNSASLLKMLISYLQWRCATTLNILIRFLRTCLQFSLLGGGGKEALVLWNVLVTIWERPIRCRSMLYHFL